MNIYSDWAHNFDAYQKLREEAYNNRNNNRNNQAALPTQPHNGQAHRAGEIHGRNLHRHPEPRPPNRAPVNNDAVRNHPPGNVPNRPPEKAIAKVPVVDPVVNAINRNAINQRHLAQIDALAREKLKTNGALQKRMFSTLKAAYLWKKKSQPQSVWSPEEQIGLDNWKNSGIGAELRTKAVEILTQFKQKGKNKLDLSGLDLLSLPTILFQMNIKELDISKNAFQSLPDSIGRITNLTRLNAANNELKFIPPGIGGLINLKKLDLSNNKLNVLPTTFGRLKNIEKLNLDSNKFIYVPDEVVSLNKLSTFSIADNELTQAPDIMNRMQKLEHLNMAGNNIETVSKVWNLLINKLKTFDLSRNQILEFPSYDVPQKLKTLNLSDNPIFDLPRTFGAIMWAEKGQLKTTSRDRGNMRIIVDNTNLIAGLHNEGRLELRDENDLHVLPDVLRPPPKGISVFYSDASSINPEDWGIPPCPPGGVEGLSAVQAPEYDSSNMKVDSARNTEELIRKHLKKMKHTEDWIMKRNQPDV